MVNCHYSYLQHLLRFHLNPIIQSRRSGLYHNCITSRCQNQQLTYHCLFNSWKANKALKTYDPHRRLPLTHCVFGCVTPRRRNGSEWYLGRHSYTKSTYLVKSSLCLSCRHWTKSSTFYLTAHLNDKDYLRHIFFWPIHILFIASPCYCEHDVLGRLLVTDSSRHLIK